MPIGRVRGHRGAAGELTVRVTGGEARPWGQLGRVWMRRAGVETTYDVEHSRSYADRLVLKLRGIDEPGAAEALRGAQVVVPTSEAPPLDEGTYYAASLVGMQVVDADAGVELGVVAEVWPTGGTDLLVVTTPDRNELLIPLARGIVEEVDEAGGRIRVRPPEGLLEVNAGAQEGGPS